MFPRRSLASPAFPCPGARRSPRRTKLWTSRIPREPPALPGPAGSSGSRGFGPDPQVPLDRRDPDPRSCVDIQPEVMGMIRSSACRSSSPDVPNDPPAVSGSFSLRYCRAPTSCPPVPCILSSGFLDHIQGKRFRIPEVVGIGPALVETPEVPEKPVHVPPRTPELPDDRVPFRLQFLPDLRVVLCNKIPAHSNGRGAAGREQRGEMSHCGPRAEAYEVVPGDLFGPDLSGRFTSASSTFAQAFAIFSVLL